MSKNTKKTSAPSNPYDVVGVCTDTYRENSGGKYGAVSWYRIINPLKKIGANIKERIAIHQNPQWALDFAKEGKIWFMKMTDNDGIDFLLGLARDFTGSKYVLDLDDDPYSFAKDHPEYKKLKARMPQVKKMIKLADHIVVSTEEIKQVIEKDNPYVTVIPNAIDPEIWKFDNKKKNDGKIHIGWIASASHIADLPVIMEALSDIVKKYPQVHIHFAGMLDMKIIDVENPSEEMINQAVLSSLVERSKVKTNLSALVGRFTHHLGTKGYEEYPEFLASLGLDIAVAAIENTQFNRCKSNIKWMEHAMLEIPMVLSDVGPYRKSVTHGVDGFLAKKKEDWVKYLGELIESEELRKKIGKEAKKAVLEQHTTDKVLPLYTKLFEKLNETPDVCVMTAITDKKDDLVPQIEDKNVEYVAFVEEKVKSSFWKTRKVCEKFKKAVMNAKIHKVLGHKYTDCEYIVWIDGNIKLKQSPRELVKLLRDKDYAFFKHPGRDCVYTEADACIAMGKGNPEELAEQAREYARNEYPAHNGLWELPVFVRKNTPKVNALFEAWWAEISRYSNRDQISFPVIFKERDWEIIPGSVDEATGKDLEAFPAFVGNEYVTRELHNHAR